MFLAASAAKPTRNDGHAPVILDLAAAALRGLDPETAHRATIAALRLLPKAPAPADEPRLKTSAFGLAFANPLGLAAGFDKNAEVFDAAPGLGFGFLEVGTLTPLPQPGNPRPRAFRLSEDRAVINRYGFNNDGHSPALARLEARARNGVVGVNVGANKDSADRVADYVAGAKTFASVADYLTINVSSPNTPGLRDLQEASALRELLLRVLDARESAARRPPLLLKIAPDVTLAQLDDDRARRPRREDRRNDRLQHDDLAPRQLAFDLRKGDGWTFGTTALRTVHAPPRANLSARRGAVSAHRRRRRRWP